MSPTARHALAAAALCVCSALPYVARAQASGSASSTESPRTANATLRASAVLVRTSLRATSGDVPPVVVGNSSAAVDAPAALPVFTISADRATPVTVDVPSLRVFAATASGDSVAVTFSMSACVGAASTACVAGRETNGTRPDGQNGLLSTLPPGSRLQLYARSRAAVGGLPPGVYRGTLTIEFANTGT